jgi:uncharacterized protein YkwD
VLSSRNRSQLSSAIVLTLLGSLAHAEEPPRAYPSAQRYNEPAGPTPRTPLERRIEALVAEFARNARHTVPRPDANLERAATELALLSDTSGPDNDTVEAALRLHGIVEPPPHLIVANASLGADDALITELRRQLPSALSEGRFGRCGAAVVQNGERLRIVVALSESFVDLNPVPRALPDGGPVPLHGRLHDGFEHPGVLVTAPDGKTATLPIGGDAHRFDGTFHCGPAHGRYQIEVTGEDRFGSTVLANFPVYCGVLAPNRLWVQRAPVEAAPTDAASAEVALLALLNADRTKAGLPALKPDAALTEVARAHCRDMMAHGFVGHVSPTTGAASDRVARAKIAAALVLENVARASTPGEVERGLMASPGHRRNILNSDATLVGIGAVLSQAVGGAQELLVTQLFIQEQAPFRAATAEDLRTRLLADRNGRGLKPFLRDPDLDRIADGVARDLASGRATVESARPGLDRAFTPLAARYRSVRSLFAIAPQIGSIVDSMRTPLATPGPPEAVGVGLQPGGLGGNAGVAHYAVIVVAVPR